MEIIRQFIVDNWQWLCSVVIAIGIFALQLLKKRPDANYWTSIKEAILEMLPALINAAEKSGLSGERKKVYVLTMVWKFIKASYNDIDVCVENDLRKWIDEAIERILTTPTKK